MANALDVARYLIKLAAEEAESEPITHMRLQKLLYYAQGWSLAVRGRPLFKGRVEAWRHGPVVREVFPAFTDFGDKPIPPSEAGAIDHLSREDCDFVASIWENYKRFSALGLSDMAHEERPWKETWGDRPRESRCDAEIPPQLMAAWFREQYERHRVPGFELDKLQRAQAEFAAGRGIPFEQAITRLRAAQTA